MEWTPFATSLTNQLPIASHDFDRKSPKELSQKIMEMYNDEALRTEVIKNGLEQVGHYSWGKMAKETLDIYNKSFKHGK